MELLLVNAIFGTFFLKKTEWLLVKGVPLLIVGVGLTGLDADSPATSSVREDTDWFR